MPSPGAPAEPPARDASAVVTWDPRPGAEELARLDAESFALAWDAAVYQGWLDQPFVKCWLLRDGPPQDPHAAGAPGRAVGWAVCQRVGEEAEVLRLGVRPALRRQGWGRMLVEGVRERLRADGATRIFLEVRAGNAAALALYRAAGFRQSGRRRNYYPHPPEDAVVMMWQEPGSEP